MAGTLPDVQHPELAGPRGGAVSPRHGGADARPRYEPADLDGSGADFDRQAVVQMALIDLQKRRVLVTGAGGFIGSHLVEALVPRCGGVRALAEYNSFNDWGWLEGLPCLADVEVV